MLRHRRLCERQLLDELADTAVRLREDAYDLDANRVRECLCEHRELLIVVVIRGDARRS